MNTVYLSGRLKVRFGGPFSFEISTVQEVFRALTVNIKGFKDELKIGAYRIIIGSRRKGREIDEETLGFGLPDNASIHIIPTTRGSKKGGTGKIIMGVALIAVAAVMSGGTFGAFVPGATGLAGSIGWGTVAMFGAAFTFAGVAQLLTPTPPSVGAGNLERPEERPSFMMNSPVNVSSQGNPIPIIGGRVRVGSVVGSIGVSTERIV